MADFQWSARRNKVALALAQGYTRQEAAADAGVGERTVYRWLDAPEFSAEVDRLSLMVDIAGRAERVRIAMRVVREKIRGDRVDTSKDLLDWLKYAQSETDGVRLDLTPLYVATQD